jgi:hypothetical protein
VRALNQYSYFILWAFIGCPHEGSAARAPDVNHKYHFTLIKGKQLPVCRAYLERLNAVDYDAEGGTTTAPYCDRPENTQVEGFSELSRVTLTENEANLLLLDLWNFTHPDALTEKRLLSPVRAPVNGRLPIWRYGSKVDIDNDGVPDNLIVWQGYGASKALAGCGDEYGHGPAGAVIERSWQIAYVMTADNKAIDHDRTQAIFGHPKGNHEFQCATGVSKNCVVKGFAPIGTSISIFEYSGEYYFDALYGESGDLQGRQRGNRMGEINTFGLFIRKNASTRNVCEVVMKNGDELSSTSE